MLSKPLIAFANCYNFNVLEDYAYGKIGNYLVSVTNSGYKKVAFITFFAFEEEEKGENLLKFKLSDELKKTNLAALNDYEVCEDGLLIRTGEDLKSFDEAVVAACGIVEKLGFPGVQKCTYCGADINHEAEFVCFDGLKASLFCAECAADFITEQSEKADKSVKKGKKRGVFASIAAAVIAFIVFVGVYVFAIPYGGIKGDEGEVIVKAMLFTVPFSAVTAVLAFLAYRLFTGRKGVERLLPCSIISLLTSAVLAYTSSAVLYTKMFSLSFMQATKMLGVITLAPFKDLYFRKDFLQYLLFSVLAVVAVSLIYSIIFEDKKKVEAFIIRYGEDEKLTSLPDSESDTEDETEPHTEEADEN